MKKIRVLYIEFDNELKAYEIPAFRSAIIKKAGKDHILFHNHLKDNFRYAYPLIQYKVANNHPVILCIEEGIEEIHHFFNNKQWKIAINGKKHELKIKRLNVNQFVMQVWDKNFNYEIRNWLALNQKTYNVFKKIEDEEEQKIFLEKILTGNILSFAKGINWTIDKPIKLDIKKIKETKLIKIKNTKFETYTLTFTTNVFLPNYTGLGKNVSKGFGIVKQISKIIKDTNAQIEDE